MKKLVLIMLLCAGCATSSTKTKVLSHMGDGLQKKVVNCTTWGNQTTCR